MEQKLKVCAYCRVSTRQEKQEMSMSSQIEYFKDLIDSNDSYINVGIYIDQGISAKTQSKRLEFMRMLEDCKQRKIDIIYTKTVSRFGRNAQELLRTINNLSEIGVRVVFDIENIDTLRDKTTLDRVIKSYMAEQELEKDSSATKFGMLRAVEQGRLSIPNPYPLIGYKYDKARNYILDPPKAKIVKEVFERYISGEKSIDIINDLNARNILTAGGRQWNYCNLAYMIRQEKYTGDAYYQKTYGEDGHRYRNRGEKAMYVIERFCPPIISHEIFEKAQQRRAKHTLYDRPKGFVPEYDCFKGKIKCGICGANYNKQTGGHKVQKNGNVEKTTYQCQENKMHGVRTCRNRIQDRWTLQIGFVASYNKMKEMFFKDKETAIETEETKTMKERIRVLLEREKVYIKMKVNGIESNEISHQHNLIIDEILHLERQLREITSYNLEILKRNEDINKCKKYLDKHEKMLEFDEECFNAMVENIIVKSKNRVLYNFKNGYTADVSIIDYHLERDEIEEVQIYVRA